MRIRLIDDLSRLIDDSSRLLHSIIQFVQLRSTSFKCYDPLYGTLARSFERLCFRCNQDQGLLHPSMNFHDPIYIIDRRPGRIPPMIRAFWRLSCLKCVRLATTAYEVSFDFWTRCKGLSIRFGMILRLLLRTIRSSLLHRNREGTLHTSRSEMRPFISRDTRFGKFWKLYVCSDQVRIFD